MLHFYTIRYVNRDPMSSEMLKMRQQLECLQAELCARGGGSPGELQMLKMRQQLERQQLVVLNRYFPSQFILQNALQRERHNQMRKAQPR